MQFATQFDSPQVADPLQSAEVRQLWWFLDGAIMHADTRIELRRGWGLCPRHAWAMALVEVELRGGVPFATTVLYADLAGGAVQVLGSRHLRSPIRHLEGRGRCPTCEYAAHATDEPKLWRERAASVNRRGRFSALLDDRWGDVVSHSCPACAGGDGPPCRPHLLAGVDPPGDLPLRLRRLSIAIHAYEKSLTADGRPVDRHGRQAWLYTLGWFAGWHFPAELRARDARADRTPGRRGTRRVNVRRLRFDVDWATEGPRIDAVGDAIAAVAGVEALLITVTEIDMETIGTDVTVEGTQLEPATVIAAIEASGAAVHSIDELAAGDRLLTFTPRAR